MSSKILLARRHAQIAATALYVAGIGLASHAQEKASGGTPAFPAKPKRIVFVVFNEVIPGLGWFSAHLFMTQRFDSEARIKQVKMPILFLHGSNDTVIPLKLGRALHDAASASRQWVVIDGAGHSDTLLSNGPEPRRALRAFANLAGIAAK